MYFFALKINDLLYVYNILNQLMHSYEIYFIIFHNLLTFCNVNEINNLSISQFFSRNIARSLYHVIRFK